MDIKEVLSVLKNVFYMCFLIGVVFYITAALIYMPCRCLVANIYQTVFGMNAEMYHNMWISFLGLIKTVLIFLFLVPALAIHFVSVRYKKKG